MIETEVKLCFPSVEAGRDAILAAGGRLAIARRLLDDRLYDTAGTALQRAGLALRLRRDGSHTYLTYKGPVQPGIAKVREELETTVGDAATIEAVLAALGYQRHFRAEKYREEYHLDGADVTVDETPMGVYVEIEAPTDAIARVSVSLGRTPADYVVDSYAALWHRWCTTHGLTPRDMVFDT